MGGCEKGEKLRSINKLGSLALHWEKLQIRGKIVTRRRYLKREHGKKVRKLKSKKRSLRNRKSKRRNDKKYSRGKKKQKENKKKSVHLGHMHVVKQLNCVAQKIYNPRSNRVRRKSLEIFK